MPTTVEHLFGVAELRGQRPVPWGTSVPSRSPGVYVVEAPGVARECPTDPAAVATLLERRPELRVDGERPTAEGLAARLQQLWLPDETILYIGLAGTSIGNRISQYYATSLGARSPHAGGWPLKMLGNLSQLTVHYAPTADYKRVERIMVDAFCGNVSRSTRDRLVDPACPTPFANLQVPQGRHKRHGITGAKAPKGTATSNAVLTSAVTRAGTSAAPPSTTLTTQRVTETDIRAGQIRIPVASKSLLPPEASGVVLAIKGRRCDAKWNPRVGPDRERSGVLRIGGDLAASLLDPDDRFELALNNGILELS